jgi:DNA-binding protein H-NS
MSDANLNDSATLPVDANTSLDKLLEYRRQLEEQIQKKKNELRSGAIAQARALVVDFNIKPNEIFVSRGDRKSPGTPKYRDPATGKTWTGRGKPPVWIQGKDRSQFLI